MPYAQPPHPHFSSENQPAGAGRKKGSPSITSILRDLMAMDAEVKNPFTHQMEKLPMGKVIALQLIVKAAKGDMRAISEVLDRMEGKAVQLMVNTGIEKIEVEIVGSNRKDQGDESISGDVERDQRPALEDNCQSGRDAEHQDV